MAGPQFEYNCPYCPQKLLAPPERVGKRVRCPRCLKPLRVPSPELAAIDPEDVLGGPLVDADTSPPVEPRLWEPLPPPPPSDPRPPVVGDDRPPSPAAPTSPAPGKPSPATSGRGSRPTPLVVPLAVGFVLAGAVMFGLYAVTRSPAAPVSRLPDPPPAVSPAERLQTALSGGRPEAVRGALAEYARPESASGVSPTDRAAVGAVLAKLCDPTVPDPRPGVRAAALTALTVWQPDAAREAVLAAVRSDDPAARRAGLGLASKWGDAEMATAVAARLPDRRDGGLAERALAAIGGQPTEAALLPLLATDDGPTLLTAIELLGRVGGPAAAAKLNELARTGSHPAIREEAAKQAAAITARLAAK